MTHKYHKEGVQKPGVIERRGKKKISFVFDTLSYIFCFKLTYFCQRVLEIFDPKRQKRGSFIFAQTGGL